MGRVAVWSAGAGAGVGPRRPASFRANRSTSSHSVKSQSRDVSVGRPSRRPISLSNQRRSGWYLVYATAPVNVRVAVGRHHPVSVKNRSMYARACIGSLAAPPHTDMKAEGMALS